MKNYLIRYHTPNGFITVDGERIPDKEFKKHLQSGLIEYAEEVSRTLAETGQKPDYVLQKYRNIEYKAYTIKKGFTYSKIFRVDVNIMMEEANLSKNALAFIARFSPLISYPDNTVQYNYTNPDIEKICELFNASRSTVFSALKELENNEVVKRVKVNGQLVIYFNPFLYCAGKDVSEEPYKLFENSRFNPKIIF